MFPIGAKKCFSAYKSGSTPTAQGYWKPRAELTHEDFSTITILFISSQHILYKKWSDDPIFPADKEVYLPGERKPWFRNSDPRARPLACVDSIKVCFAGECWPMNDPDIPPDAEQKLSSLHPEFWFMFASLWRTSIYNAIEKRLGRGLLAQTKVSQFYSEALGDDHWADEVAHLVATLHARTQINAWSIASGEDSIHEGKDGYTLITPEKQVGNLCGKFKFNPPGYVSIKSRWFIACLWSFPILLFLSRKWPLWPWADFSWNRKWPFVSWVNESSNTVGLNSQVLEAEDNANEESDATTAESHPRPQDATTEVIAIESNESNPSSISLEAGQTFPVSHLAVRISSIAAVPHTEETAAAGVGVGVPRRPFTPIVSLNPDQELPISVTAERSCSPRLDTTEEISTGTGVSNLKDDPIDVEWEPLVIGKLIELLVFLSWTGPLKAIRWRQN